MNTEKLTALLGEGTEGAALVEVLTSLNLDVSEVSTKEIRTEGSASLLLKELGIELIFRERRAFEAKFAQPRSGGFAVLVSVIIYPNGNAEFKSNLESTPFCKSRATDRAGAISILGSPTTTDSDDGLVRWDQWELQGLQMRATYDKNLLIRRIGTSIPMRKT